MKLNSFMIQISSKHSPPLKTEQQQKSKAEGKEEAMGGRTNGAHLQVLAGMAVCHPKHRVRLAQQLTWVFKRDSWLMGIGKKKSAMTEEMSFTKNEVIFNTFYSTVLGNDAQLIYLRWF